MHDGRGVEGSGSSAETIAWRERVMERLTSYDGSALHRHRPGGEEVRVLLAFHVTTMDVARLILRGNMAELSRLDAGYFGQALYFSLDAIYSLMEYGEGYYELEQIPLLLCAVVVGNGYPVIESPYQCPPADVNAVNPAGHLGQPIMSGADHHFAVVAKDEEYHGREQPLPVPPARWEQYQSWEPPKLWSELVVKEAAQVLPMAVAVMERKMRGGGAGEEGGGGAGEEGGGGVGEEGGGGVGEEGGGGAGEEVGGGAEVQALIHVRDTTNYAGWSGDTKGWDELRPTMTPSEAAACRPSGVEFDGAGRVTKIDLERRGLSGSSVVTMITTHQSCMNCPKIENKKSKN